MGGRGFTERVRQELARRPPGRPGEATAELAALVLLSGSLHLVGRDHGDGDPPTLRVEVVSRSGAVARRVFVLAGAVGGIRPVLRVHAPSGVEVRTTYAVEVDEGAGRLASTVGLLDRSGRPGRAVPGGVLTGAPVAFARGAVLAAGSVSAPGRPPHLEVSVPSPTLGAAVADALAGPAGRRPRVAPAGRRRGEEGHGRVVLKSGEAIGALLSAVGATGAFLEWEEARLRRSVRRDATRLANADAANVRRAIEAAAAQVHAVERAVAAVGWDGLDDRLRAVALARLANPDASLAELGAICDPPVDRSTVHRRLQRLSALAAEAGDRSPG